MLATLMAVPATMPTDFAAAQGKPLVIARNLAINSLDPSRAACDTCLIYLSAVYETLVRLGPDGRSVVAGLAESWQASDNNTKFTFKLNPKAVFSDGSPVEAKDVVWSWNRLANAQGGMSWLLDTIKTIDTPDAHTISITLSQPDAEFIGKVMGPNAAIINSVVAERNGARATKEAANTDTAEPWFLANSAGSGPFVLEAYSPNDVLRFKRNEKYWGDPAKIDEVVMRQVKDSIAQSQMIQNGDADIAMQISPDTALTMQSPDIKVDKAPSYNFIYMAISPGAKGNTVPLTKPVREAISLLVDYDGLVDFAVAGAGRLQASPIPNGFPGTDGLPQPKQDVDKAKALLEQAGLKDGFDLEAKFPNQNYYGVDMSTLMQKLQLDLAKGNVRLKLEPMTFEVWLDVVRGDGTPFTASYYAPDYYGSGQFVKTFGMIKGTRWSKRSGADKVEGVMNPKEEELLTQALAAPEAKQGDLFRQVGQEMINDRVIVPLVNPDNILVYRSNVVGVRYSINEFLPLRELSFGK
ncbi:ABC transporter substrate-binding protein [Mesorhizobium sp. CU2]|nr:ABC transporter substrate-binding protein [Mesorhizobium sp. CU3]TPO11704.1 ABC transporter substrate-binding protein [Mesorhizobium sp. CU2]